MARIRRNMWPIWQRRLQYLSIHWLRKKMTRTAKHKWKEMNLLKICGQLFCGKLCVPILKAGMKRMFFCKRRAWRTVSLPNAQRFKTARIFFVTDVCKSGGRKAGYTKSGGLSVWFVWFCGHGKKGTVVFRRHCQRFFHLAGWLYCSRRDDNYGFKQIIAG